MRLPVCRPRGVGGGGSTVISISKYSSLIFIKWKYPSLQLPLSSSLK